MSPAPAPKRLSKELTLLDVYAIATGATLSSGLFLLPGLAAEEAGPAIVLCYLLAALPLIPASFSMVELATAMPRAGGAYYFLDRSIGPGVGTVGGFGTWVALTLKTAFALVGMSAYVELFFPNAPHTVIAVALTLAFGTVNMVGAKSTGRFQFVLLVGVLAPLAWFAGVGLPAVHPEHFRGFFDAGFRSISATAGLVYISYVGVTNVASISEEVKNPERNLPLGIFLALTTSVLVYGVCTSVMVGVIPGEVLKGNLTPAAEAALRLAGTWGSVLISVAALLAFASIANAGILSASRYPLAMSRDQLLPPVFARLSKRGTPAFSIAVTVATILSFLLFINPFALAELASAFQLLMFALLCLAVIVMRESGLDSYDPGYRSPLYPWMQIVGVALPLWLIHEMGWMPTAFSTGLVAVGVAWYFYYAREKTDRLGAIYHVFERLGRHRFGGLDRELRGILKEKGLREQDPFEEIVTRAFAIDSDRDRTFDDLVAEASQLLSQRLPCGPKSLASGFLEGTRMGATPVTHGIALPHLRIPGAAAPGMVVARCRKGISIETRDALGETHTSAKTYAVFFLVSPEEDPGLHLRLLAQIANRVDQEGFLTDWNHAVGGQGLKETLLRHERYFSLTVDARGPTATLINRALKDLQLPDGCLVALIRRGGKTIVPRGPTVLQAEDVLTVIGEESAIRAVRTRFGPRPTSDGD